MKKENLNEFIDKVCFELRYAIDNKKISKKDAKILYDLVMNKTEYFYKNFSEMCFNHSFFPSDLLALFVKNNLHLGNPEKIAGGFDNKE